MDELDQALWEAWVRVGARVRGDRVVAVRRGLRRSAIEFSRPIRPWCLCLRAGDTRLGGWGRVPKRAAAERGEHEVSIFSDTLRQLCKPVWLDWPGVDCVRAGGILGRSPTVLMRWVKKGYLRCEWRTARACGKRGPKVPHVWSERAIDPNADFGVAGGVGGGGGWRAWGTLWQEHWRRVPDGLEYVVGRVPRHYVRGDAFRGWMWVCPGLAGRGEGELAEGEGLEGGVGEDGDLLPAPRRCGRLVERLYVPLRVWTIGDSMGEEAEGGDGDPLGVVLRFPTGEVVVGGERGEGGGEGERENLRFEISEGEVGCASGGRVGQRGRVEELVRRFQPACGECWRVNAVNVGTAIGWNVFVSHVSGGLLYGHEVKRPRGWEVVEAEVGRKQAVRRAGELWGKREEIAAALAAGKTIWRVAKEFGVTHRTMASFAEREGIEVVVRGVGRRKKKVGRRAA